MTTPTTNNSPSAEKMQVCSKDANKNDDNSINNPEGVCLRLDPDSFVLPFHNVSAKLLIRNNTNHAIAYGERYEIEVFDNGTWRKMTLKSKPGYLRAWHAIRMSVNAHEKEEKDFSLDTIFYEYTPGRYRICQEMENTNSGEGILIMQNLL